MESIFFILCNTLFFSFIYYVLHVFEFSGNIDSSFILLAISLLLTLPSIIFLYILKKDRKKYFIFSSIWSIIMSFLFFKFGTNILNFFNFNSGLTNFTMYLYNYLFMFSPLISIFFVSLHKIFEEKKQLFLLIAFKYIFPIILGSICMNFLEFSSLLWLLAITDFITIICSVLLSTHKIFKHSKH